MGKPAVKFTHRRAIEALIDEIYVAEDHQHRKELLARLALEEAKEKRPYAWRDGIF